MKYNIGTYSKIAEKCIYIGTLVGLLIGLMAGFLVGILIK